MFSECKWWWLKNICVVSSSSSTVEALENRWPTSNINHVQNSFSPLVRWRLWLRLKLLGLQLNMRHGFYSFGAGCVYLVSIRTINQYLFKRHNLYPQLVKIVYKFVTIVLLVLRGGISWALGTSFHSSLFSTIKRTSRWLGVKLTRWGSSRTSQPSNVSHDNSLEIPITIDSFI